MNLTGNNLHFRRNQPKTNTYRLLVILTLLVVGIYLLRGVSTRQIVSPFEPTAIPTRTAQSYMMEGETHFVAGNLDAAVAAYNQAIRLDPQNVRIYTDLARFQVYSSALLATDSQKRARLEEALDTIDRAVEIAPDDSTVHAVRSFALDWLALENLVGEEWEAYLTEASDAAIRANTLDTSNALAKAYYAEILVDQMQWVQAEEVIQDALELDPDQMDVHRVKAYVNETLGDYGGAIEEYQEAARIYPNLTFLYYKIGVNLRQLKRLDEALDYFERAANINAQLGIKDPVPYLAISNTYSQRGDFYAAALNVRKALEFDPTNPKVYGDLGMVYFKSRNYEGAILALECAVRGCNPLESCIARLECDDETPEEEVEPKVTIEGMPLTGTTVLYYYTYGSALAGMSRPNNDFCEKANKVLSEVRSGFSGDELIMSIIAPSEEICRGSASSSN